MCCDLVVLRKLIVFGVADLQKNEPASAFMKLVFERLEQYLNASTYNPVIYDTYIYIYVHILIESGSP